MNSDTLRASLKERLTKGLTDISEHAKKGMEQMAEIAHGEAARACIAEKEAAALRAELLAEKEPAALRAELFRVQLQMATARGYLKDHSQGAAIQMQRALEALEP